jgi:hypothetical protein
VVASPYRGGALCRILDVNFREFHFRNCLKSLDSPEPKALPSRQNGAKMVRSAALCQQNVRSRHHLSYFSDNFSTHFVNKGKNKRKGRSCYYAPNLLRLAICGYCSPMGRMMPGTGIVRS